MKKIIKISDSATLKLKELMDVLDAVGCSDEEKIKARKIFKIYLVDVKPENK
jgi:energy-converting hydrogenase A subunit M